MTTVAPDTGVGPLLRSWREQRRISQLALAVDGTYTVVAANRGIAMLLDGVAEHLLAPPLNAMRLTLHPQGLAPRIRNLRAWRADLLAQMERQIALARSAELRELYEEVAAY